MEPLKIQWFPGHMTKTKRVMEKDIKQVDVVIELLDARIPYSSMNPMINEIVHEKPRMVVLNKSDMSEANLNTTWVEYYKKNNIPSVLCSTKTGAGMKDFRIKIDHIMSDRKKFFYDKGMTGRKIRAMIVGVTNVGKSSFINHLAGRKKAKVEDRPGVTRGRQWLSIDKEFEILDTPGVLWPKFDNPYVGEKLALVGSIRDEVIDIQYAAMRLITYIKKRYSENFKIRYNLVDEDLQGLEYKTLEVIGRKRGMLLKGNEVDIERAAIMLLDEFRSIKIGRITLETPDEVE